MIAWYVGIASITLLVALALGAWLLSGRGVPVEGPLPMTPLQRRAWIALATGIVALGAGVGLFVALGLPRYDSDPAMRFAVYGLLALGFASHLFVLPRTLSGRRRRDVDERDIGIFERAPAIQGVAVLCVLAAWAIGLTEGFHDAGAIPLVFPSLIFLSALLVHQVALSLSILIGYRRDSRVA